LNEPTLAADDDRTQVSLPYEWMESRNLDRE
jgi:hypothetical protein